MNDKEHELACWRVWYRLKEEGPSWERSIYVGGGISKEHFDSAIDLLMSLDVVEEVEHSDRKDECKYRVIDEKPALIPVFGPYE